MDESCYQCAIAISLRASVRACKELYSAISSISRVLIRNKRALYIHDPSRLNDLDVHT